ncbi:hypothetical protein [Runella salmonicolor]|uniref:Uncharacterized protein n=1 Tax=Runella salmonicolor TaxID=2950278 RepID=A0ABT1FN03_9BACT|nr:hypothetical protein [Runella salmonicolor]MCP1383149.1 hypothetical protein [Runella salmonicolor]
MKLYITILLSYFFSSALAQTCEKTQIKDPILIDAIGEFIINCNKANEMYKSMGVIHMGINPDSGKAEKRISLWASLTDSFKENPPQHYAHLFGKIILIHQFNEKSAMIKNEVPPEQLEALLNEVGDRVFIKQQRRGRWVETYHRDGSLKRRNYQIGISMGGGPTSITLLIDKKTGEVRKLKSV